MPVPDDAGGSGEAGVGGVRVDGRGRAGQGGGATDGGGGRAGRFETRGIVQRGAWKDRWRKIILDAFMTLSHTHKSGEKKEDFYWLLLLNTVIKHTHQ
jgi:hypothetical protein